LLKVACNKPGVSRTRNLSVLASNYNREKERPVAAWKADAVERLPSHRRRGCVCAANVPARKYEGNVTIMTGRTHSVVDAAASSYGRGPSRVDSHRVGGTGATGLAGGPAVKPQYSSMSTRAAGIFVDVDLGR